MLVGIGSYGLFRAAVRVDDVLFGRRFEGEGSFYSMNRVEFGRSRSCSSHCC